MAILTRVWNLLRARRHANDLDDELAFHIEMRTRDNIAAGMSEEQARHEANRKFGNLTAEKEKTRDMSILAPLDAIAQDTRYGWRALLSSRAVSALVIAALALGLGANTAIFSIANALVFRSLPVKDPANLYAVEIGNFMSSGTIEADNSFTWALWNQLIDRQDVLTGVFAYAEKSYDAALNGGTKAVTAAYVTPGAFRALGLDAVIGRTLDAADDAAARDVVISDALWSREFASDPAVIGRPLIVEGKPFTIAGVLPARFAGMTPGHAVDVYLPLNAEPYIRGGDVAFRQPTFYWLQVFGRLRAGVGFDTARQHLLALSALAMRATLPLISDKEINERRRPAYLKQSFALIPAAAGVSYFRDSLKFPLEVLSAIGGLLLLLTCFTVANLLLARGSARQSEIAVRIALGAGRGRIVRQLMIEGLLLALGGTAAGVMIARFASTLLVRSYSVARDPLMLDVSPDWTVFGYALALALVSAILFGVAPALRASHLNPADSLRGGRATASGSILGIRRVLLAGQLAISVVLVTAAVLFGATLRNLMTVDMGFRSDRVLLGSIDLRRAHMPKSARREFYAGLLERMQRVTLAESASLCYETPISGGTWQFDATAETAAGPKQIHIHFNAVSPDFFKTFGTQILAGRGFTAQDNLGSVPVALINARLALAAFGTTDAIGRRMSMDYPQPRTVEIVGIVQDARYKNLRGAAPPTLYAAVPQYETPPSGVDIALRSRGSTAALARDVGTILTREFPSASYRLEPFSTQISDSISRERTFATLCSLFAVLALTLAAIGIYGVLSYFVAQRRAEIGIRMALGASPALVRRLIYRQSFLTCAMGLSAGCLLAFWGGRYTRAFLYGILPGDVYVFVVVVLVMAAVAVLATGVPALRASQTETMRVLRCE